MTDDPTMASDEFVDWLSRRPPCGYLDMSGECVPLAHIGSELKSARGVLRFLHREAVDTGLDWIRDLTAPWATEE